MKRLFNWLAVVSFLVAIPLFLMDTKEFINEWPGKLLICGGFLLSAMSIVDELYPFLRRND